MTQKLCTCCRTPITVPTAKNVRAWVYPFIYGLIAECPNCMSTACWVMWRLPDEMLADVDKMEAA